MSYVGPVRNGLIRVKIESSTDEFSPWHLLRLGADFIFGLFLASVSVMALVSSLALSPFIRALHRRHLCTRVSHRPHTLLILGYTTLAEAEQRVSSLRLGIHQSTIHGTILEVFSNGL